MLTAKETISQFKEELVRRGHPLDMVWLQEKQMFLAQDRFYIYSAGSVADEAQVAQLYDKVVDDLECGATFMLVAVDKGKSYCTLLLDSFGSNSDIEIIDNKLYLWCDPYVSGNIVFVTSFIKWIFFINMLKRRKLSSLDYAFTHKQLSV